VGDYVAGVACCVARRCQRHIGASGTIKIDTVVTLSSDVEQPRGHVAGGDATGALLYSVSFNFFQLRSNRMS
jgi:hypothetical protein